MIALLFPGQGSQAVGMGRALATRFDVAREVFESADRALGFPISARCFEGPADELRRTACCQPAVLTTSVAVLRVLETAGLVPDVVAGHSLGEYTALVAAGALSFEDAVRLVHMRGMYMQEAVPEGVGTMAAVMGLGPGRVEALCSAARNGTEVVEPANLNGPAQVVVSGHRAAVERVVEAAGRAGGSARRLDVSAPFHSSLMAPAAERLAADLARVRFAAPSCPVVANVDGAAHTDPATFADLLVGQVASPVRWAEVVETLVAAGAEEALEVGHGRTLAGLVRRIDGDLVVHAAPDEPDEVAALLDRLGRGLWDGLAFRPDLRRYTRSWREGGWSVQPNGIMVNADRTEMVLPNGLEWRFDDPTGHGF